MSLPALVRACGCTWSCIMCPSGACVHLHGYQILFGVFYPAACRRKPVHVLLHLWAQVLRHRQPRRQFRRVLNFAVFRVLLQRSLDRHYMRCYQRGHLLRRQRLGGEMPRLQKLLPTWLGH